MVKFKDFLKLLSVFQVLFKANLIFKDFSRQTCLFKYFSSLCPVYGGEIHIFYVKILFLYIKNTLMKNIHGDFKGK